MEQRNISIHRWPLFVALLVQNGHHRQQGRFIYPIDLLVYVSYLSLVSVINDLLFIKRKLGVREKPAG